MRRTGNAQSPCHLVIGAGLAARNGSGELIDAAAEGGNVLHVEGDIGEIDVLPAQHGGDGVNCDFGVQRRALLARLVVEPQQAAPCVDLTRLRQLHARMPALLQTMPQRPIAVSKIV
jgi:hypothetical protein